MVTVIGWRERAAMLCLSMVLRRSRHSSQVDIGGTKGTLWTVPEADMDIFVREMSTSLAERAEK